MAGTANGRGRPQKRPKKEKKSEVVKEDAVHDALSAYGEAFLRMFDDYDEAKEQAAAARAQASSDSEGDPGSGSSEPGSDEEHSDSDGNGGPDAPASAPQSRAHVIETVFHSSTPRRSSQAGASPSGRGSADAAGGSAARGGGGGGAGGRAAWKAFMSPKADRVHSGGVGGGAPQARRGAGKSGGGGGGGVAAEGGELTREDFQRMRREVEQYGAAGLDKKAKRAFEAQQLQRLGAKVEKGPRVPASLGKGMAKKAAQRDAAALELAIESGMVSRKGLGKKKRRAAAAAGGAKVDRGLREDGGAYRNGVLRVKPPPARKPVGLGKRKFKIPI